MSLRLEMAFGFPKIIKPGGTFEQALDQVRDYLKRHPEQVAFFLTFGVSLTIFLATLAPELTLEFSGYSVTSAAYAGVASSPGFPLWTIYSWIFVHLVPFSNLAVRVSAGSAVATALACGLTAGLVAAICRQLANTRVLAMGMVEREAGLSQILCGVISGLGFGLTSPVWRMAVVAETWALSFLLFSTLMTCLVRWEFEPKRKHWLLLSFGAFGLLLVEQQELIVLAPGILLWLALTDAELGRDLSFPLSLIFILSWILPRAPAIPWFGRGLLSGYLLFCPPMILGGLSILRSRSFGSHWRIALACVGVFVMGLLAYGFLPVTSMTNPPANWAYPRTVQGFFHLASRGQYEPPSPTHEIGAFLKQCGWLREMVMANLGTAYLICSVVPFVLARHGSVRKWLLRWGTICFCAGPVLVAALNPTPEMALRALLGPYFGPLYQVLAVGAGVGIYVIVSLISKLGRKSVIQSGSLTRAQDA